MADKKSNEPRRENGRIPTYQTAYHGAKKKDPLTNLARIIVEKFDKRRVPENTIDTIPFDQIYPDGLCRIGDNFYSKMVQFYDINYQLAQNDEKQHIFAEYCQFLNYFDETIHFQFCFINQRVDMEEYKKVISINCVYTSKGERLNKYIGRILLWRTGTVQVLSSYLYQSYL